MTDFNIVKNQMDIKNRFWQKVKELRKELWLSQEKLAERCKLHRTYIWNIERGEKNVALEFRVKAINL